MAVTPRTQIAQGSNYRIYKWAAMANGDTGAPLDVTDYSDKTVHIAGTFGTGGSVSLYGSISPADLELVVAHASSSWVILKDAADAAITETAAAMEAILSHPTIIAPKVTAGDETTAIDVYVKISRS